MTRPTPTRAMCDSMIYDEIVADPDVLLRLRRPECPVVLVSTHVQDDEHANILDEAKRDAIANVPRVNVPTADFVIGFSRLDMARLGDGAVYEGVRGKSKTSKYARDGLIASSAKRDADVLVTEDRRLERRCRELGVEVWRWRDFRAAVLAAGD